MNKQKLKDYALRYYFKYYPSNQKLINKLSEKSQDRELSFIVFNEIKHLLKEDEIIKSKIDFYLSKSKNLSYIKNKLKEKLFPKEKIEEAILKNNYNLEKSLLNQDIITRKVEVYKKKGKSINYIKQKLIEREEDKELIDKIINKVFGEEKNEIENIKKEYSKIIKSNTKIEKNKIIQKLMQKGFRYEDIKYLF